MKRIVLSTALTIALSATAAFAQQAAPPQDQAVGPHSRFHHQPPSPQKQAEFLSKKLNLTPDQTARLEPIFADRDQKFQALRQNTALTHDQLREQMKALHETTEQQLAGVLTPDQLQQLKSMRHDHRGGFGHHNPNAEGQAPAPGV